MKNSWQWEIKRLRCCFFPSLDTLANLSHKAISSSRGKLKSHKKVFLSLFADAVKLDGVGLRIKLSSFNPREMRMLNFNDSNEEKTAKEENVWQEREENNNENLFHSDELTLRVMTAARVFVGS